MNYISSFIKEIKSVFTNMDSDVLKILKIGLKLCFVLILISTYILYIYLSVNTQITYNIGISLFKSSTIFICSFVAFSICFSRIKSNI